jgi:hypothetical protein
MWNIRSKYDLTLRQIVRISPRFAVMLAALFLSIVFIILDILSVTNVIRAGEATGVNPFWKLSFVFKCLTDSVVLDDFKTALDRLRAFKISRLGSFAIDGGDMRNKEHRDDVRAANSWNEPPPKGGGAIPVGQLPPIPSPDTDSYDYAKEKPSQSSTYPGASHIEDERFTAVRSGSRDRDAEENPIDPSDKRYIPEREASTSHMLPHQESWLETGRNSDSTDLDAEYAQAVREMTNDGRPKQSKHDGIGLAR